MDLMGKDQASDYRFTLAPRPFMKTARGPITKETDGFVAVLLQNHSKEHNNTTPHLFTISSKFLVLKVIQTELVYQKIYFLATPF